MGANHHPLANALVPVTGELDGHERRCLANGDDSRRAPFDERSDCGIAQCASDQRSGEAAAIAARAIVRTSCRTRDRANTQWTLRGSVERERPVTTLNFLRRRLITWSASSLADNWSSCDRISRERDLNGGDGALGVILALLFETLSMLEELFAVEINEDIESVGWGGRLSRPQRLRRGVSVASLRRFLQ